MLSAELLRREAVVLARFVQVRLGGDDHARRLAVQEVLLPGQGFSFRVSRFSISSLLFLRRTYLVHFGTVLEGARVVDVVHQADHVAGQVGLGQEVEVRHHLVELREGGRGRESADGRDYGCFCTGATKADTHW